MNSLVNPDSFWNDAITRIDEWVRILKQQQRPLIPIREKAATQFAQLFQRLINQLILFSPVGEVLSRLDRGDSIDGVVALVPVNEILGEGLRTSHMAIFRDTFEVSGEKNIEELKPKLVEKVDFRTRVSGLKFDVLDRAALEQMQQHGADRVVRISEQTRQGLRSTLAEMTKIGTPIGTQTTTLSRAEWFRRGVGLLPRDSQAIFNLARRLEARGVSPGRVAQAVRTKSRQLLRLRASNIGRTESAFAAGFGQRTAWQQAVDHGLMDKARARREWILSPIPCPKICDPMGGQLRDLDTPFVTGEGNTVQQPGQTHPSCLCDVLIHPTGKEGQPQVTPTPTRQPPPVTVQPTPPLTPEQAFARAGTDTSIRDIERTIRAMGIREVSISDNTPIDDANQYARALAQEMRVRGSTLHGFIVFPDQIPNHPGAMGLAQANPSIGYRISVSNGYASSFKGPRAQRSNEEQIKIYQDSINRLEAQPELDNITRELIGNYTRAIERLRSSPQELLPDVTYNNGRMVADRNSSLRAVVHHEFGHIRHFEQELIGNPDFDKRVQSAYEENRFQFLTPGRGPGKFPSVYAREVNHKEFFAESYAAYVYGDLDSIDPEVINLIEGLGV